MTLASAALAVIGGAISAQALSITPSSGTLNVTRWQGPETSQAAIDLIIGGIIAPSTELYKQDVGKVSDPLPAATGLLAANYKTTFDNEPLDPSEALIEHLGGLSVGPNAYLLVKGGGPTKFVGDLWYLYDLTALGWNGTEDLELTEFWPNQGAISHVTLYGDIPGTPDGGTTALLLGAVMAGFAALRRKLA
jgi:hypothetical protein